MNRLRYSDGHAAAEEDRFQIPIIIAVDLTGDGNDAEDTLESDCTAGSAGIWVISGDSDERITAEDMERNLGLNEEVEVNFSEGGEIGARSDRESKELITVIEGEEILISKRAGGSDFDVNTEVSVDLYD